MNSFKTELFKISFEEPTGQDFPHITIASIKSGEIIVGFFNLASLCVEVDNMLTCYRISPTEAIKIIRKSASFFILNGE